MAYFSLMQRKVILAFVLLWGFLAGNAQQKDNHTYKNTTTVTPSFDLGGNKTGLSFGKRKKAIPEPPAPLPQEVGDYHNIGSKMPALRVVTEKGKIVATADSVKNEANLFVMMFNPTCEHCEEMTVALEQNIALFKASQIVLIAAPMMGPYLEYFANTTKYTNYPALKVGLDSAKFIDRTFNYVTLPQINIYDKDRKLIKTFSGLETIDSLKPYIQ